MYITNSYMLNRKWMLPKTNEGMRKMSIKKFLSSRKAISPILATLLLIVIAVAAIVVTYAWITTYMGSATQNAGFIPYKANVNFMSDGKIAIDIGNSGTASGQILQVYIGTSASTAQSQTTDPETPITVAAGATPASFNVTYSWIAGQTYYFKIVPNSGAVYTFQEQAPQS
jgi:flagellin-like protein